MSNADELADTIGTLNPTVRALEANRLYTEKLLKVRSLMESQLNTVSKRLQKTKIELEGSGNFTSDDVDCSPSSLLFFYKPYFKDIHSKRPPENEDMIELKKAVRFNPAYARVPKH